MASFNPCPAISASILSHENKVFSNSVFHRPQATGEFIDIGERMPLTNQRVQLRKAAVPKRDARRASLMKFACEETSIVEIAEPP